MKILIGTKNEHKINEFRNIFKDNNLDFEILSLKDFKDVKEPSETGKDFKENAYLKAKYYYDLFKIPVISDDSGLCVDALFGYPGIYSARFASSDDKNASSKDNRKRLLSLLENEKNRKAHFTCAICYIDDSNLFIEEGYMEGEITYTEKGENGFGYDSIFLVPAFNKTASELDEDVKNKLSHRYNALIKVVEKIKGKI